MCTGTSKNLSYPPVSSELPGSISLFSSGDSPCTSSSTLSSVGLLHSEEVWAPRSVNMPLLVIAFLGVGHCSPFRLGDSKSGSLLVVDGLDSVKVLFDGICWKRVSSWLIALFSFYSQYFQLYPCTDGMNFYCTDVRVYRPGRSGNWDHAACRYGIADPLVRRSC